MLPFFPGEQRDVSMVGAGGVCLCCVFVGYTGLHPYKYAPVFKGCGVAQAGDEATAEQCEVPVSGAHWAQQISLGEETRHCRFLVLAVRLAKGHQKYFRNQGTRSDGQVSASSSKVP